MEEFQVGGTRRAATKCVVNGRQRGQLSGHFCQKIRQVHEGLVGKFGSGGSITILSKRLERSEARPERSRTGSGRACAQALLRRRNNPALGPLPCQTAPVRELLCVLWSLCLLAMIPVSAPWTKALRTSLLAFDNDVLCWVWVEYWSVSPGNMRRYAPIRKIARISSGASPRRICRRGTTDSAGWLGCAAART